MRLWLLRARWPLAAALLCAVVAGLGLAVADALVVWVRPAIDRATPTLACAVTLVERQQSPAHLLPTVRWTVRPVPWCSPPALQREVRLTLWGLVALVGLVIVSTKPARKVLTTLWYWVQGVGRLVPGTTHGRARWATRREVRRRRRLGDVPFLLGVRGHRPFRQRAWLTDLEQNLNVLIIGQPGVGKSSALFIANMLRRALWRPRWWRLRRLARRGDTRPSGVATDPKGEFYATTSRAFAANGYVVRKIDFFDPEGGHRYNPLAHIHGAADAQRFAEILLENTGGRSADDPFWDNTAILMLIAGVEHLNHLARTQGRQAATLRELRDFVGRADYQAMRQEMLRSCATARRAAEQFMANVTKKPELEGSIQSGLPLRFQFLNEEAIADVTDGDDIDFGAMADIDGAPWQVYVVITRGRESVLRPLVVAFFTQLFDALVQDANKRADGRLPRPVICDLDEVGTIGKIADLAGWENTLRSANVWLRLAAQTFAQLVKVYGALDAEAIAEGAQTHVYFGGATVQEHAAEWMSKQAGRATVVQRQANAGRDREEFVAGQGGTTRSEVGAELMSPDDFLRMKRHWMVVVPRHAYPYKMRAVPYDRVRRLARAAGRIGESHRPALTRTSAPARGLGPHEWADVGAPVRVRPRHAVDWSYDL